MSNQDILELGQLWNMRTNATPDHGILGRDDGVIVDPQLPLTNVFVRFKTSNGLSPGRSVILPASARITLTPGLPVLIGYNHKLQPIVTGIDTEAQASTGVASQTSVQQSNSDRVQQSTLETLNIVAGGALTVNLKGWNVIANGVYDEWSWTGIDLASFVPSAGYLCYAAIFVLADLSGVEVFASTPNLISDFPEPVTEINECLAQATSGSTPTWAVKLTGGLASFDQTYLTNNTKDLRQLVNNNADATGVGSDAVRFTQTATVTVANSSAETTLLGAGVGSLTLSANALAVGRTLRITASGVIGSDAILAGNITVKFKLGSTVIVSTGTLALTSALSAQLWQLDLLVTCRTTGGSGTVMAQGAMRITVAAADAVWTLTNGTSTVTVDTTVSNAMDVTVTFSVADSDNTISATNVAIESLN